MMQRLLTAKYFLIFSAISLLPIALSYGIAPQEFFNFVGIEMGQITDDGVHIFRAVMFLYFGHIVLWITGALKEDFRKGAMGSLIAFMLFLALSRALSPFFEGIPSALLIVYFLLELFYGAGAVYVYYKEYCAKSAPEAAQAVE